MQQDTSRPLRVGELLRRELTSLLRNDIKDPRVSEIILYDVVVTNDLGLARIYFSPSASSQDATEVLNGLESASGYLRNQLGKNLKLRKIPELRFIIDETEANSQKIEELLQKSLKTD